MLKPLALVPLLLAALPAYPKRQPVEAIEAIYGATGPGHSVVIRLTPGGEFDADMGFGRHIVRKAGEVYEVRESLTGAVVASIDDVEAILREKQRGAGRSSEWKREYRPAGVVRVQGRPGEAFTLVDDRPRSAGPALVLSRDRALASLGSAWADIARAEGVTIGVSTLPPMDFTDAVARGAFRRAAPLRYRDLELTSVRPIRLGPRGISLPAAAQSRARLEASLSDDEADHRVASKEIVRVAIADRRLWLLDAEGSLFSMADGGGRLVRERPGGAGVDLCVDGGDLVVLTGPSGPGPWRLSARRNRGWRAGPDVARRGENFVGWSCEGGRRYLLTSGRLLTIDGVRVRETRLAGKVPSGLLTSALYVTPDAAFLGLNAGEWGGGLSRIDRLTGRVEAVEGAPSAAICGSVLSSSCDPVNGIAPIPWRPGCIAAAVGLVHMESSGRLVAICPGKVELLFAQPEDGHVLDPRLRAEAAAGGFGAVPFFALTARGRELVAVGADGFYRIGPRGLLAREPLPRFRRVGGILASFERADAALVLSMMNRRASMSGAAPLVAYR